MMSPSSDAALAHLQRIRPNDGWGIETKQGSGGLVRLTRRNVPVTDGYFLDIHVDHTNKIVVGILTGIQRSDGTVQAQKLVDGNGKLLGNTVQLVAVKNYQRAGPAAATTTTRSASTTTTTTTAAEELSLEQNQELVRYGICAVVVAVAVRVVSQSIAPLLFFALPLLFVFLLSTCPVCCHFCCQYISIG
jgi:hypothetical protein